MDRVICGGKNVGRRRRVSMTGAAYTQDAKCVRAKVAEAGARRDLLSGL
jgi:hypothetical protein